MSYNFLYKTYKFSQKNQWTKALRYIFTIFLKMSQYWINMSKFAGYG